MADFTADNLAPSGYTPNDGVIDPTPAQAPILLGALPSPPTIGSFVPTIGSAILRAGSAQFDVTDADGLAAVVVAVQFADGTNELVHDGTAFRGAYAAGSSRANIAGGLRYVIEYDAPGWPTTSLLFRVTAVDDYGTSATSASYTLTISDPPAPPDVTAPAVADVVPAAGTPLQRTGAVAFTVSDAGGLRAVLVLARYETDDYEVIHDGAAFAPKFAGISSRSVVANGYRYTVRRRGGWPAGPTITAIAIDNAGNEA